MAGRQLVRGDTHTLWTAQTYSKQPIPMVLPVDQRLGSGNKPGLNFQKKHVMAGLGDVFGVHENAQRLSLGEIITITPKRTSDISKHLLVDSTETEITDAGSWTGVHPNHTFKSCNENMETWS